MKSQVAEGTIHLGGINSSKALITFQRAQELVMSITKGLVGC